MTKIIAFRASPINTQNLQTGFEINTIQDRISQINGMPFEIKTIDGVRRHDLQFNLNLYKPEIVHFSGHGSETGALVVEGDGGYLEMVESDALEAIFANTHSPIKCVLLNLCYSEIQAEAIVKHVPCVIGMQKTVKDELAIAFARAFYSGLACGLSIKRAFDQGIADMKAFGATSDVYPVLLGKKGLDLSQIRINFKPRLMAEFIMEDDEIAMDEDEENYCIALYIEDCPQNAVAVVYQLNHDDFDDPFIEMLNSITRFTYDELETFGDFEIRATIWLGDGKGIGLTCQLSDALKSHYETEEDEDIIDAIDDIAAN